MKKPFWGISIFIIILFCFIGCEFDPTTPDDEFSYFTDDGFVFFTGLPYPNIPYYGVNIGIFPPKARDWIERTFTSDIMENPNYTDLEFIVKWSENNNSISAEAYHTNKAGESIRFKWGNYNGSSSIFTTYGEYAVYQTLKYKYEYKLYVDEQLKKDPVFAEIIKFAKKLSDEIEYDWGSFSGYTGAAVKPTPGKKLAVCDGYANEVMEKALQINSVLSVERWTSTGHAWNVLNLADGRKLYFDLTWFDNEHINSETGEIYQTDDYGWENITFFEHLFHYSNIGYGTKVFHHEIGKWAKTTSR